MAKITKEKLIGLIQESLDEYMNDGYDMGHGGGCAMEEPEMEDEPAEEMDLEAKVDMLSDMMRQLMDMMGGQAMMELQAAAGEGRQSKEEEEKEEDE